MRILQICNYFYPHIGGIEQVARDIVGSLEGNEQKLICFNHEKGTVTEVVDGIEITRVGCQAKISSQSIALGFGKQLKKILNEFKPELVIFHFPNPFVGHFLVKYLKRDFKLVVYWHLDIVKQKILKKFFKGQTLKLLRRADKIIATSPNYIDGSEFLPQFRDKCVVIPNCVNVSRFEIDDECKKKAESIRAENSGKTICFAVGRHIPYKGMEYLVRASKLLGNDFKIYIGGTGPLTDSLKQLASGDEKVEFLGRVSDEDLKAYMLAMDIFCFPSITKNEAFGIALAEGMYFEKPAVTFTIPGSGVNYVNLDSVTGLEVPNMDVEKYAQAISTLASDPVLRERLGKNAKQRVTDNFLYENFRENIKNLVVEIENSGDKQ